VTRFAAGQVRVGGGALRRAVPRRPRRARRDSGFGPSRQEAGSELVRLERRARARRCPVRVRIRSVWSLTVLIRSARAAWPRGRCWWVSASNGRSAAGSLPPRAWCSCSRSACASGPRSVRAVICPASWRSSAPLARAQAVIARWPARRSRSASTRCSRVVSGVSLSLWRSRRYRRSAACRLATPSAGARSAQLAPAARAAAISCGSQLPGIRPARTCPPRPSVGRSRSPPQGHAPKGR